MATEMAKTAQPTDGRRFLRRAALFLAPFVTYFATVAAVDPRGEFGTRWLPLSINNARFSKPALFRDYAQKGAIEGLILGSSRAMSLPPRTFEEQSGLRFFNFAVNDGTVEDFAAVFRWVASTTPSLRALVIGIDPHTLFDGSLSNDLLHNEELYRAYLGHSANLFDRAKRNADLWQSVFSRPYFEATAYSLALRIVPARVPPATFEDPDGLLRPAKTERAIETGSFDLQRVLPASIQTNVGYVERAGKLSDHRRKILESILADAQAKGIHVSLWMTCLHPAVIERLERETRYTELMAQTLAVLAHLHSTYGADVHDLSSPSNFGGAPDGFYDGAHMDPRNAELVARKLAADFGATRQLTSQPN